MESIHCIDCGGYVAKPRNVAYRARAAHLEVATAHDRACTCLRPTLLKPVFRASAPELLGVGAPSGRDAEPEG